MGLAKKVVLLVLFQLFLLIPLQGQARNYDSYDAAAIQAVAVAELPPEARATLQLIQRGGPFPFSRDGIVFGNREHLLPQQPRGYYHEYTVKTPGVHHRGARRIVCGRVPECYYTDDHYRSFKRIKE